MDVEPNMESNLIRISTGVEPTTEFIKYQCLVLLDSQEYYAQFKIGFVMPYRAKGKGGSGDHLEDFLQCLQR